jgi:hypothetical protein
MIKYGNIALTTTITLLTLYHLFLLLLVRLGGYIANLSDLHSYRLIGKLTTFLQLQEFSFRNIIVGSSTSAARLSLNSSKAGLAWLSLRRQLYVLLIIRVDYNNNPPNTVSFMSPIVSTSGRIHSEFVRLLFIQVHRETDRFFAASGVQLAEHDRDEFPVSARFSLNSSKAGLA